MEYFLDIGITGRTRKERFAELGAALKRPLKSARPTRPSTVRWAVTDTGKHQLLGTRRA